MINISILEVPLDRGFIKLKDNQYITAEPLYKNIQTDFYDLHRIVSSDYRQYSPFNFIDNTKISKNWNNSSQDLIIFDVDNGLTVAEAKVMFSSYKYLICTTKSHMQDKKGVVCERFRVILKSDNIPKGDDYFTLTDFLEVKYPFIDKQVNTKTGAFLGSANCKYWYNEGKLLDCATLMNDALRLKQSQLANKNIIKAEPRHDLPIDQIKQCLSRETVADIVQACGFEVNRQFKFKYREGERTPSASIRQDGYIKDFGSDMSGDIIAFVQETKQLSFKDATAFVGGFVNVAVAV